MLKDLTDASPISTKLISMKLSYADLKAHAAETGETNSINHLLLKPQEKNLGLKGGYVRKLQSFTNNCTVSLLKQGGSSISTSVLINDSGQLDSLNLGISSVDEVRLFATLPSGTLFANQEQGAFELILEVFELLPNRL